MELPVTHDRGTAGDHDPPGPAAGDADAATDAVLELVVERLEPLREADRVVDQGALHDDERVEAADGRVVLLPEGVEPGQSPPLPVHEAHGRGELVRFERPSGQPLEPDLELSDLLVPEVPIAGALLLRHLEDMEIPALRQEVPGLLASQVVSPTARSSIGP